MANSEYDNLFDKLIAAPLTRVIGRRLRGVNEYVLASDGGNKYLPQKRGARQAIHLVFDDAEIEFDWDSKSIFLDTDNLEYHLTVSDHSVRADNSDALAKLIATDAEPWRDLIGQTLTGVEVLGDWLDADRCSPQAVVLSLDTTFVVVCAGTASTHPKQSDSVGDGDEILVFSKQAWALLPDQKYSGVQTLRRCWRQVYLPSPLSPQSD
ncbi:hypothetical protein CCAX7_40020 [Capsulimonas corticalis]|uniref:Uncharacterized protein n=1 Tax=Capsulimonas corticalis TaxID=2219043 RepID=A0A402D4X9_9BACT|nr:hypothetical protein [Capsulimonas corticalis]BDI31951.1 hypothetical protein CCAX7_40020 [Capsulimonas corticalis]